MDAHSDKNTLFVTYLAAGQNVFATRELEFKKINFLRPTTVSCVQRAALLARRLTRAKQEATLPAIVLENCVGTVLFEDCVFDFAASDAPIIDVEDEVEISEPLEIRFHKCTFNG